jgi:hypothetical protein
MLGRYFPLVAIAAAGYWYWSGPYQTDGAGARDKQFEENARTMQLCIRREASMTAAAGMAGTITGGDDTQALCARQHNLYLRDGKWHRVEEGDRED